MNSTNSKLDLSSGAVAQALLKAGGQDLQTQCTAKAPLSVGEVAVTGAGKIKNCQHVIHTVVPSFDQPGGNAEKVKIFHTKFIISLWYNVSYQMYILTTCRF